MKRFVVFCLIVMTIALVTACADAPTPESPAAADVAGIHTSVASTMYAALPAQTVTPSPLAPAGIPTVETPADIQTLTAVQTPADVATPTPEIITVPTMENVPTLAGYHIPGIRVLEQPAAVTRAGITLAVEQVMVTTERIELVYTVRDIPQKALFDPFTDDTAFSCGGPASYPNLLLPDGTVITPESYLLDGKTYGNLGPFARTYLIHIYRAMLPAEVSEMKLVLDCIGLVHLERAPCGWEVPFRIAPVK